VVFGHEQIDCHQGHREIVAEAGKPRWIWQPTADDPDLVSAVALHADRGRPGRLARRAAQQR